MVYDVRTVDRARRKGWFYSFKKITQWIFAAFLHVFSACSSFVYPLVQAGWIAFCEGLAQSVCSLHLLSRAIKTIARQRLNRRNQPSVPTSVSWLSDIVPGIPDSSPFCFGVGNTGCKASFWRKPHQWSVLSFEHAHAQVQSAFSSLWNWSRSASAVYKSCRDLLYWTRQTASWWTVWSRIRFHRILLCC